MKLMAEELPKQPIPPAVPIAKPKVIDAAPKPIVPPPTPPPVE